MLARAARGGGGAILNEDIVDIQQIALEEAAVVIQLIWILLFLETHAFLYSYCSSTYEYSRPGLHWAYHYRQL